MQTSDEELLHDNLCCQKDTPQKASLRTGKLVGSLVRRACCFGQEPVPVTCICQGTVPATFIFTSCTIAQEYYFASCKLGCGGPGDAGATVNIDCK